VGDESANNSIATSVASEAGSGIPRAAVPGRVHSSAPVAQARLPGRFQGDQSIGQRLHPASGGLYLDGKPGLKGRAKEDRIAAREWISMFLNDAMGVAMRNCVTTLVPVRKAGSLTFPLRQRAVALTGFATMAKALTKSQIVASVAETVGITKKQAVEVLEAIVALAYKNAKNSFTLPGLGKLVLVNRKARVGRNPATGEQIQIPAKRVVKFRVAKAAKDAILEAK
jgi:DNA-binding protein HU-beta